MVVLGYIQAWFKSYLVLVSGIFRLGLGFLGVWFKVTLGFRQGLLEGLLEGWFRVSLGLV